MFGPEKSLAIVIDGVAADLAAAWLTGFVRLRERVHGLQ
jgi:hypothetical protein